MTELHVVRKKTTTSTQVIQPERGKLITSNGEDFLTTAQAARVVSLRPETIVRWVHSGELPAYKIGRKLLIKRCDLLALIERSAVTAKAV